MTPTECVRAAESDDVAVGEAHAVKDVPQVGSALGRVGESPVRGTLRAIAVVLAAERVGNVRPARELDG